MGKSKATVVGRVVGGAVAVLIGIAACSSPVPEAGEAGAEIEVLSNFTSDVARGKVLDQLMAEFNEAHEGQYTVVSKPQPDWPTLQQQIRSRISADNAPDVFVYNYNPTDLSREESGQFMDWTKALEDDPDWAGRFKAGNLDALTINGEVVGIPGDQSPALFYYSEELFAQAGISEFPSTWDDLVAVAQTLHDSGVGGIAMMTADDAWHTMNIFSYLATAAGGQDAYGPGANLDSAAIETAAEYTARLLELSTPDAVGGNYAASSSNFVNGQAAMIVDGPWLISSIQSSMADPCSVKVAPAPTFGTDVISPGYTVTDSLNVWAAAKQDDPKKAAGVVEWMKFFTSNEAAVRMAIDGEYPLAVDTQLTPADSERASCQMAQVLEISNAAPTAVVQIARGITAAAQAELPSLLESLALGQSTPAEFARGLDAANDE
ncbi:MAG: extracellular solute-binding protein [Bifidobacteriaceae bacterium]|nr:extracellular solute-binding protein [Bifidobacteriaceae bacterium]